MSTRRRSRRHSSALRPFWFVGSAALLAAVIAGYFAITWPGFALKHLRVTGNRIVSTSEIVERAQVKRNANVWLQNTGAIARRVAAIPYILSVRVTRVPPADIVITVRERHPLAVLRSGGKSALVDRALRVLQAEPFEPTSLPVFVLKPAVALRPGEFLTQQRIVAMRTALLSLRVHGVAATEIENDGGDVSAKLGNGVHLLLGDEANVTAATPLVEPILTRFALLGRFAATIDLRSPSTPVVTERRNPVRSRAKAKTSAQPRRRNP